jgi:hypothetical protein
MFSNVKKAIGAALGGLTGAAVVAVLGLFSIEVAPELAASIALILATFGTWLAPKNVPTS